MRLFDGATDHGEYGCTKDALAPNLQFARAMEPAEHSQHAASTSEPPWHAMPVVEALAVVHSDRELVIAHVWESPLHPEYSEEIIHNEIMAPVLKDEGAALAALQQEAVTVPLLQATPVVALWLIGGASFVMSLGGAAAGTALGTRLGRRLEIAGGLTWIAIGVKTLVDHLGSHAG